MEDSKPQISVIMSAYNAESTIEKTILSVINQSFTDWELLIIDDNSVDATSSIAQRFELSDARIQVILNKRNHGVAANRNYGVSVCRGNFIAFLDSDDTWQPDKLEKQLKMISKTGAELCYTSYALVNTSGEKVRGDYIVPEQADFSSMLRENVIGCSTVLILAELARIYAFEETFYHEDYVLWMKLLKDGHRAVGCREVLTNWCYRENSRSYNKFKSMQKRWEIYRKALNMSFIKSISCICSYAAAGFRKYGTFT